MDGYGFQEAITVKPDDQLDIPHDELEKECDPLVLTADDPKCPENVEVKMKISTNLMLKSFKSMQNFVFAA